MYCFDYDVCGGHLTFILFFFSSSCRVLVFQLLELLKKVEFVIVPVANPDGYCVS